MGLDGITAQRMSALDDANKIRRKRRDLKRQLREGRDPAKVLRRPPAYAETMKVEAFLAAVPMLGERKIHRMLLRHGISGSRTLGAWEDGGLCKRQRIALAETLEGKEWNA